MDDDHNACRRWRASHGARGVLLLLMVGLGWTRPVTGHAAPPAQTASSAVVTVSGRTDVERVSIGSPFRYVVDVRASADVELIVPVLGGQLGDFFITDFGDEPVRAEGDAVTVSRWYTMVTYRPGLLFIPGLTVQYRDPDGTLQRVDGEDVSVQVVSLIDRGSGAADIQDIKPPVSVPFDWTPVLVGVAGLLVLAAIGLIAARFLRRVNAPAAAAPPPPPDVVALEALARLRRAGLTDPEERARWFVALSAIVREYIEGRFGLRAPEMTTEEFIVAVQRNSPLNLDHRQLLSQFLAECDLVKFARLVPDLVAAERAYDAARRFVNESRGSAVAEEASRAA
jgi:hypothetical protein